MTTGCPACDKIQLKTGSKIAVCPACEIEYEEHCILVSMNRIKELKKKLEGEENDHSSN